MTKHKVYDITIIGAGINGLCTAFQLIQRGHTNIALVEAKHLGHDWGSSHGKSRITRSAYADPVYVYMMQYCHQNSWPTLERVLGTSLRHPCKGLFYGPSDGQFQKYQRAMQETGANVQELSLQQAQKVFPQFRFHTSDGILQDHTSAVVSAAETIALLHEYCKKHIDVYEHTPIVDIDTSRDILALHTPTGVVQSEKIVVTAGPWTYRLFPALRSRLTVVHQNVYYLDIATPEMGQVGIFPVWVELGMEPEDMYYGLPEFRRQGIKVAKHNFQGDHDPDVRVSPLEEDTKPFLERFQSRLHIPIVGVAGWERCQYTNTHNEDFILAHHPRDTRIVIGAGFSGHGFKFGPMTGEILADLVLAGGSTVPGFDAKKFAMGVDCT